MSKYLNLGKQLVRLYRLHLSCEDVIKEFLFSAIPVDAVEVVRCRDCKHRPHEDEDGYVHEPGWGDYTCPYLCEDSYYSRIPEDDFFCKRGEKREDEEMVEE